MIELFCSNATLVVSLCFLFVRDSLRNFREKVIFLGSVRNIFVHIMSVCVRCA